jgi:hypothetical protein
MIYALLLVRDEADIIGENLEHHLRQVDHVLLTDNGSTDDTRKIAASFGDRVTLIDEPGDDYRHSEWVTRMARLAAGRGASWAVPIDGDEFWSGLDRLRTVDPDTHLVYLKGFFDHPPTDCGGPFSRDKMPHRHWVGRPKVNKWGRIAFRPHHSVTVTEGSHNAHPIDGRSAPADWLVMDHYPVRSPDQFRRKVVAGVEALNRRPGTECLAAHWRRWYRAWQEGKLDDVYHDMVRRAGRPTIPIL